MKVEVKIPSPYTKEQIVVAMKTLISDPNFSALCATIQANDISTIERQLISGFSIASVKLTQEETESLRYRRDVFVELLTMPKTIIDSLEMPQNIESEERTDPYFTQKDLQKDAE